MAAVQQLYEYSVEMNYVFDGVATPFEQKFIKYLLIENDYDSKNMPIIFVGLALDKELFHTMDDNIDKGYISLIIKRKQTNAPIPLWVNYIESQFTYFILDEIDETYQTGVTGDTSHFEGRDFKTMELALLKTDIINNSKKVYNVVLNNVTLMDVAHYGTSHMPMLIEPVNPGYFDTLLIPPLTTVSKYLNYINGIKSLYSTAYRFFVDFNRGYLLSSSGKPLPAKGDVANSVVIIEEETDLLGNKFNGQEYDDAQKAYTIRIATNELEEYKNNIVNKSYNNIIGVSSSGQTTNEKLKTLDDLYGTTKTVVMRVDNENMDAINIKANNIGNSSFYISFNKSEIDTQIITPNMEYSFTSLSSSDYTGKYLLSKKQEVFKQTDGDSFICDVNIILRKIMS